MSQPPPPFDTIPPRLWEALFQEASVCMALTDEFGKFIAVNQKFCEMLEYTEGELLARTWQSITDPEDVDADMSQAQRCLAGEIEGYEMAKRYISRVREVRWSRLRVRSVTNGKGKVIVLLATILPVEVVSYEKKASIDGTPIRQEPVVKVDWLSFLISNWKFLAPLVGTLLLLIHEYLNLRERNNKLDDFERHTRTQLVVPATPPEKEVKPSPPPP